MSRSEPNDGKTAITTTIEKINQLNCDEVSSFCSGKSNSAVVKPSEIIDEVSVENLLYGIAQVKTREDTETKLRAIASSCYDGDALNTGQLVQDIVLAYRESKSNASDESANDEKWRNAIIAEFRE